jgi:hypothetical protein
MLTTAEPPVVPDIAQSLDGFRTKLQGRSSTQEPAERPPAEKKTTPVPEVAGAKSPAPETKSEPAEAKSAEPEAKAAPKFVAADDPLAEASAKATPADPEKPVELEKAPKAAQLREAYDKLKEDFSKAAADGEVTRKELAAFQKRAKEYEDQFKALEPLKPRIKEYEDRLAQYDERLRMIDYVQHPEFHEKFVKPVSDALAGAHAIVKEMVVEQSDGTQRLGNEQDFAAVLAAPNLSEATKVAKVLFGPDLAQTAITYRTQVLTAERRRVEALKDAGLKSQEFAKVQGERQHAEAVKFRETFQRVSGELADKYAPIYKTDTNDKEASEQYQRGLALANSVIERDPSTPNDEFIQNLARVQHRAASFPVQLLKNQRLQQQIDTLQAKLAKYEKSEPSVESAKESDGDARAKENEDPNARLRRKLEATANRRT